MAGERREPFAWAPPSESLASGPSDQAAAQRDQLKRLRVVVLTAMDLTEEDRARLNGGLRRVLQKGGCGHG